MINGFNKKINCLSIPIVELKTPQNKTQICRNLFLCEKPFNRFFINSKYNTGLLLKNRR
jgi:hypothetical protein